MKKEPLNFRLRITQGGASHTSHTYLTRNGGHVSYFSANETPLALSNLLHGEAAEMRFKLEDALDGVEALAKLRATLKEMWKGNPALTPAVELLS